MLFWVARSAGRMTEGVRVNTTKGHPRKTLSAPQGAFAHPAWPALRFRFGGPTLRKVMDCIQARRENHWPLTFEVDGRVCK